MLATRGGSRTPGLYHNSDTRRVPNTPRSRLEDGADHSTLTLRKVRAVLELRHVEVELSFEQRPRGCGPSSSYDTSGCTSHHGVEPSGCTSHHGVEPSGCTSVVTTHALSPQQENNAYACGGVLELRHEWLYLTPRGSTQWLYLTPRG